jgi:AraC-like DNA-binding protein
MSNLDDDLTQSLSLYQQVMERIPTHRHIKIHSCYNRVVPRHWRFQDRINADFHMIYIKGGEGRYECNRTSVPFEKGKIILVSPGMQHSALQDTRNPPSIIPVRFGFYDNATTEMVNHHTKPFNLSFISEDTLSFQLLFEKLFTYSKLVAKPSGEAICSTIINEILLKIKLELLEGDTASSLDERIDRVKRFVEHHPHGRYLPNQLAEMAGLSEKYFRELFKKQVGQTPLEYQIKVRMTHARLLLTERGQKVHKVALSLGYPDPYSFSKQFKQIMGYPPIALKGARYEAQSLQET